MNRLNWLFTLTSITVLLVTIERFSGTTTILLDPYHFIRLHELIQGSIFLTISIILSFFVLQEISGNFSSLKTNTGFFWALLFTAGAYLYGLGEGWHEVASFTFNEYCNVNKFSDNLCGGLFTNDYYTGNIYFFIGAIAMSTALLFLQKKNPTKIWNTNQLIILIVNSVVYAFTFFAYAAFDRVLVGLYATILLMIIADGIFFSMRKKFKQYPFITYSAFAYTLATIASLLVRMLRS